MAKRWESAEENRIPEGWGGGGVSKSSVEYFFNFNPKAKISTPISLSNSNFVFCLEIYINNNAFYSI